MLKLALVVVAVLGALLLGATMAQHERDRRALVAAQQQIVASDAIVQSLTVELEDVRAALAQKPKETIVTITAPCHTPPPRVVPVFPRDSQLTGRGGD